MPTARAPSSPARRPASRRPRWRSRHDATGAGWTFEQTRSHNLANELGTIDGGGWVGPVHDAAGNMTQYPKAGSEGTRLHAVYDAWNRLVEVRQDSGGSAGSLIVSYRYDGLNQRVRRLVAGGDSFDFYFNEGWQVLEVRRNADTDPLEQWVWDVRYVDAPAVLFRDSNTDGTVDDTLYVTQDANFNVTGLVNAATGAVVERYAYSPYGMRSVMDASFGARGSSSYDFPLGHQGGRWDELAGVYDFRYRPYLAHLGRWMGRDPNPAGVYSDGGSLYQYVRGNPLNRMDPTGLATATIYIYLQAATTPPTVNLPAVQRYLQFLAGQCVNKRGDKLVVRLSTRTSPPSHTGWSYAGASSSCSPPQYLGWVFGSPGPLARTSGGRTQVNWTAITASVTALATIAGQTVDWSIVWANVLAHEQLHLGAALSHDYGPAGQVSSGTLVWRTLAAVDTYHCAQLRKEANLE